MGPPLSINSLDLPYDRHLVPTISWSNLVFIACGGDYVMEKKKELNSGPREKTLIFFYFFLTHAAETALGNNKMQ